MLTVYEYGDPEKIVENVIDSSNLEIGALVVAQIKTLCPVAEKFGGTLRNSYMYKTDKDEGGFNDSGGERSNKPLTGNAEPLTGYFGSNEHYAPYVNLGTRKMAAQPHVEPAIDIVILGAPAKRAIKEATRVKTAQKQNIKVRKYGK